MGTPFRLGPRLLQSVLCRFYVSDIAADLTALWWKIKWCWPWHLHEQSGRKTPSPDASSSMPRFQTVDSGLQIFGRKCACFTCPPPRPLSRVILYYSSQKPHLNKGSSHRGYSSSWAQLSPAASSWHLKCASNFQCQVTSALLLSFDSKPIMVSLWLTLRVACWR